MSQKIQTPVNNAINEALGALEVAKKVAEECHDWRTLEALADIWFELIGVREETRESQITNVDSFFEGIKQNA